MGCGSSDSSPPLTKAEFIKQGDAICRKADKEQEIGVATYPKKHSSINLNSEEGEETMVLKVGLPPIMTAAEELEELEPPSGDEAKIDAIIVGLRQGVEEGRKDPIAITEGTSNPFSRADRLAAAYGFKDCSEAL